jgi:lipopolysaccharide transport system ATP-binding protein
MAKEDVAVVFADVWKSYPSYHRVTGGIKNFLFHLPEALRELRERRPALEGVSFTIRRGECFGFIGRNGAGKSTTLGLIAGVLSPERGTVRVNGRVSPLLELGAGFHPELSGRENILLNGVLLGLSKKEVLELEEEIIAFSELEEFIDQPVRTYSSGMYAKLGFSVISILKPEILLIDEVLAVGDLAFAAKCSAVIEGFRQNGDVTIVLVSHGLSDVANLCDRAAWIEDRTVKMIGSANEVVAAYESLYAPPAVKPRPAEESAGIDTKLRPIGSKLVSAEGKAFSPPRRRRRHGLPP